MTGPRRVRTLRSVDRLSAVRQLPSMHAVAVRLRDDGADAHVIAVALDIEVDQVSTLLHIADRKLANLMGVETGSGRAG